MTPNDLDVLAVLPYVGLGTSLIISLYYGAVVERGFDPWQWRLFAQVGHGFLCVLYTIALVGLVTTR